MLIYIDVSMQYANGKGERLMAIDVANETAEDTLQLDWMREAQLAPGVVRPGRRGLTLDEVHVGSFADIPSASENATFAPRGAQRRPGAPHNGLVYRNRADVWSENAALLYEEAVQRQWSSATDVPWERIEPLPDDLELAMCQLCTFLTEVEFIAGDAPAQWTPAVSADFFETKLYLATQVVDEARHLDVFRKRALANGGGLLEQGPGTGLRNILASLDFSEMSVLMHVLGEGFVQTMFRAGEFIAQNEAEKRIFRLCAQDESRHLGFGVMHLRYLVQTEPERREELHSYLDRAEGLLNDPRLAGVSMAESLAILLGGGKAHIDEGMQRFMAIRKRQVNEYMHRLEVAGMGERRARINPAFGPLLDPPRN